MEQNKNIFDLVKSDLLRAFKEGRREETRVLRLISSALHNKEIEKRKDPELKQGEFSNEDILQVLKKEIKQRQKAIELYERGKRPELAERERGEIEIIKRYLPKDDAQN